MAQARARSAAEDGITPNGNGHDTRARVHDISEFADRAQVDPDLLATLDAIQQRILWLSTNIIHHANHVRPSIDGIKVGGHQASSASVVSILTALYFHSLKQGDRVSIKPHASPVDGRPACIGTARSVIFARFWSALGHPI